MNIPETVIRHIQQVFADVNDSVSAKLSSNPNLPEESFDIAFIDRLSVHSAPRILNDGWGIRIAAHFIGSIRHYRRYEIADIGVVIAYKRRKRVKKRKLILLQSKRLYPINNDVLELDDFDYELGLGMITRDEQYETSIFSRVTYEFNHDSIYGALRAKSNQCKMLAEHYQNTNIPVYYLLYNPNVVPWKTNYPRSADDLALTKRDLGARVFPSEDIDKTMRNYSRGKPLKFRDLCIGYPETSNSCGWKLEDFFVDAVRCRSGYVYGAHGDKGIRRLFSRKSGPIFCVIEITIENDQD